MVRKIEEKIESLLDSSNRWSCDNKQKFKEIQCERQRENKISVRLISEATSERHSRRYSAGERGKDRVPDGPYHHLERIFSLQRKIQGPSLHRKKRFTCFPSPAGMSLTKLPLGRNNSVMTSLFPPRESLVVTSRLGTGNSRTFFTVQKIYRSIEGMDGGP